MAFETLAQLIIILAFIIISFIVNRKERLEIKILLCLLSILSANVFYAGIAWILRSINFEVFERSSYENFSINFLIGFLLVILSIYSLFLKKSNGKKSEDNKKDKGVDESKRAGEGVAFIDPTISITKPKNVESTKKDDEEGKFF